MAVTTPAVTNLWRRSHPLAAPPLDAEAVEAAVRGSDGHGATEVLATRPLVEREIAAAIGRLNGGRAPAERIKAWRILPRELTVAGGELTPTLKVKRAVVIERSGDLVEEMYAR
jgi:long-chain acyl-CoA synthetase